jgi:hypothetical protein
MTNKPEDKRSAILEKQLAGAQEQIAKAKLFLEQKTQEALQLQGRMLEAKENEKTEVEVPEPPK